MGKIISKNPFIFYIIIIVSFSVLYTSSCSKNPSDSSKEIILPDSNLNYTDHIFPLFTVKCGSESGCHSPNFGGVPARGLDLTRYDILIEHLIDGSTRLIIPFQGEESFLYHILLNPILGRRRMPPDRASLSPNNIFGIKTWIDEGALQFSQPD
jgi:hypothetical protein